MILLLVKFLPQYELSIASFINYNNILMSILLFMEMIQFSQNI